MTACDHADDGPCTAHGTFTPDGTDLVLCGRHYNIYRREHGKQVVSTTRPRHPDGEATPGFERRRR